MKLDIKQSKSKNKRFTAVFTDTDFKKTIHFGLKNPKIGTYIDHGDKIIRKNYIARHQVREKKFYNSPLHASTLSRFVLWGDARSLQQSIKDFKQKFKLE
tara:strand:- start:1344 stop:1643 length:300 start_codon:yes stop_codon:yes gene_type:complete